MPQTNCITVTQVANWITEPFKYQYTIQFPSSYEGIGMAGFEGNIFRKTRTDNQVNFSYSFCSPVYCEDFGSSLISPIPDSFSVYVNNVGIFFDQKKEFCSNGEIEGIFYHTSTASAQGLYYMRRDTNFLQGLNVEFEISELTEVENILKTIQEE